ncbi:hypothetical protein SAMN04488109_1407 [Chryseolinea serpens]|jgi:hypothetical protein|uniref:Uncharacterized protein n=1 Tax=Chryseolinea serpens TaxID=947013 RepID=A0A1M5LUK4_9BACT|nr:hypothetical protein [Chryseolinea serpens]SHG68784.1 hypothetical protein SAMN04488109_1407 [Chryseolinea serpens]
MKFDSNAKASLVKREMEIKRLVRQMEFDRLHNSPVYKNLSRELQTIQQELVQHQDASSKK